MLWKHKLTGRPLLVVLTACCAQGFLLLGYDQGVMSGIIGADNRFGRDFNNPDDAMQGNIVALYDIGCVLGSILVFFIGERTGRKKMIASGGSIMIIGAIILASSYTRAQLIVGRIVIGFGNGINSSTIPVFQAEVSPAKYRGALLTFDGTITIFGPCDSLLAGLWHFLHAVKLPMALATSLPGCLRHLPRLADHRSSRISSLACAASPQR